MRHKPKRSGRITNQKWATSPELQGTVWVDRGPSRAPYQVHLAVGKSRD